MRSTCRELGSSWTALTTTMTSTAGSTVGHLLTPRYMFYLITFIPYVLLCSICKLCCTCLCNAYLKHVRSSGWWRSFAWQSSAGFITHLQDDVACDPDPCDLLSNPERFFPTFFYSFSTLRNYIMLSMCEGTISHKRSARKIKKNSSIIYCKNQTQKCKYT
jgi:hypothetical protein